MWACRSRKIDQRSRGIAVRVDFSKLSCRAQSRQLRPVQLVGDPSTALGVTGSKMSVLVKGTEMKCPVCGYDLSIKFAYQLAFRSRTCPHCDVPLKISTHSKRNSFIWAAYSIGDFFVCLSVLPDFSSNIGLFMMRIAGFSLFWFFFVVPFMEIEERKNQ